MDPGLARHLATTVAAVQASFLERTSLWDRCAIEGKSTIWVFAPSKATNLERRFIWRHQASYPVYAGRTRLHLSFDALNGKRIMFWHPDDRKVDYDEIDAWFAKELPSVPRVDAMSFKEIFHLLEPPCKREPGV